MTLPDHYVVAVKPRSEATATEWLTRGAWRVFYPRYRASWSHARRQLTILKPFIPGYVFVVKEPGCSVYEIDNTPGVSHVLRGLDFEPAVIKGSDPIMAELIARAGPTGIIETAKQPLYAYHVGDKVLLKDGPWAHFVAEIVDIDNKAHAVVWLQMFNRVVPIQVPHDAIGEVVKPSPDQRRIRKPLKFATASVPA